MIRIYIYVKENVQYKNVLVQNTKEICSTMKISNLRIIEIEQWGESSGKRQQNSRRRFAKTKKAGLIKVQEPYRTQNKLETEKRML